ncbi:MAG: hypothetical protein IAC58_04970 [Firmicutes bacterium]|uniref:Uncharacterized protein n=1 Tax=Candidatus Onthovivens merdipullorum TaxID=2840889 RepID=A0A9D9DHP7_9BACL|nr:hypothetical protein [Candidatus Onthovivens merdipullorum]
MKHRSFIFLYISVFSDEQDYLNFYQNSDLLPFYEKETPSYLKSSSISIIHKNNEEINTKIDRTYDTYEYEANFLTESLKENNPLLSVNIEF